MRVIFSFLIFIVLLPLSSQANYLLMPMDKEQDNHLKAYGIAYWILENEVEVKWLLNYRGGSFMVQYASQIENECVVRGVSYQVISDAEARNIEKTINAPDANMDVMKLHKAPKIAVYSPKDKKPWDDAVTLVLTYAEIPYDVVYDAEVMDLELPKYDWLHLHHEDFTGQYGKFYRIYHNKPWYKKQVRESEKKARKYGFKKVSGLKLAVAKKIKKFVAGGGYLFAMCSATDTYDISLAAEPTDICAHMYDGDPMAPDYQQKLNYDNCIAFENFDIVDNPLAYEFSNIDSRPNHKSSNEVPKKKDYFTLFEFSAKWDPIPTILTQNHENVIQGFMGQTTAFNKDVIKPDVLIMGERKASNEARYIHGKVGKGFFTFYGGHDPEDYKHFVGEKPTDLNLHPNSPAYRLILNNILFPAAKKKKQKT